jgi:hypothetical protein
MLLFQHFSQPFRLLKYTISLHLHLAYRRKLNGRFYLRIFLFHVVQLFLKILQNHFDRGVVSPSKLDVFANIFGFLGIFLEKFLQPNNFFLKIHILRFQPNILIRQVVICVYLKYLVLLSMMLSCCLTSFSK